MANIIRRDPFDDLFRGFFVRPVDLWEGMESPTIKLDVKENADAYTILAELPGMKKEDIHVHVDGDTVSLSAERKQEREVKEGERMIRTERSFGKVSRSFQLGHNVDEAKASAKFADGVLELTLPKKLGSPTKRLTIE